MQGARLASFPPKTVDGTGSETTRYSTPENGKLGLLLARLPKHLDDEEAQ